jgi:predicted cupin superfamily sugar epimerase
MAAVICFYGPMLTPAAIIAALDLKPHPEGGHYRETFRDVVGPGGRAHATAIYYLLQAGEESRWHRVDAAEVWHWYAGEALELTIAREAGVERVLLGPDFSAGERPQAVVPAHHWQSARPLGSFTLIGCTVAPGFEFAKFELAPEGWSPED